MERTNAFWSLSERNRESYNVDALGHHVTRHPMAEKIAVSGEILDERPVGEFSYEWQENVGDLKDWMNEYDDILRLVGQSGFFFHSLTSDCGLVSSTILEHRVETAMRKSIKDAEERSHEMSVFRIALRGVRLVETIKDDGLMIFQANHRHPPCLFVVTGNRWAVYEAPPENELPGGPDPRWGECA